MAKIVIFGAGDIARLANFYFKNDSAHEVAAFAVDKEYKNSELFLGLPLIGLEDLILKFSPSEFKMFIALSYAQMNKLRADKFERMKQLGYDLVSYVSTKCTFLSEESVGENCFILENNTIQPFVKIGNNVTLWSGNHIGHDSVIEDNCFISSHVVISGHCRVGKNTFIGVNSTIAHNIKIAPKCLIGAGSVITKDTVEKGVYVPQKSILLEKNSDQIKI